MSATEASTVTFTIGAATELTGDANISLGADIQDFDTITASGMAAIEGSINGDTDLSDVDAAVAITINDGGNSADIIVADGASISVEEGTDALDFTAVDDGDNDVDSTQTLNLSLDAAVGGTLEISDDGNGDAINVVNMEVNVAQTAMLLDLASTAADVTLNVTGDANLVMNTLTTGGGGDLTIAAAGAGGDLTGLSTAADVLSITTGAGDDGVAVAAADSVVSTGAGDDTITLTSGADFTVDAGAGDDQIDYVDGGGTVDGGDGTDEFATAGAEDLSGVTLSNIEVLDFAAAADFSASQLNGATYIVLAGSPIEVNAAGSMDITSLDLSGLTFADATDTVTVDLSAFSAADFVSTTQFTYVGSDAADTVTGSANADTIDGGAGIDNITGGTGADSLTGGAGADTFVFASGDSTEAGVDTVADLDIANDTLSFDSAANDHLADIAATSVAGDTTEAGDTVTVSVTDGVMTAAGDDAANLDTLAEWVDASETIATAIGTAAAGDLDGMIAFEFDGDTYVLDYTWTNGTTTLALDNMVVASGITGITDLDTAAAANTIVIA